MFRKRRSLPQPADKTHKLQETVLPTAKLRFCPDQLQNLNYIFLKKLQDKSSTINEKNLLLARSVSERLVQRLVCCAGMLDDRFSSKFLITNHEAVEKLSNNLEYIVRLDSLSTPQLYQTDEIHKFSITESDAEYPAAYARVRLHASALKTWNDCANSAGYLRRDKVQARLVELLAQAAASEFPTSPLNVDESVLCATPAKIVTANTLYAILKIPSRFHVFYGPNGNVPRFPDPRDFRLAIVDEPGGARIKIEFLSPALSNVSVNVRILVAIGVDVWPSSTDFPARVTIGHTDALLYHQAAQTGMYLVGYGVQSSAWEIRLPAAQDLILNHYGPNSTVRTILDVLLQSLEEIDGTRTSKKQVSYKILNRHMLLTLLLKRLEENSSSPSSDLLDWSPMYLSSHVLHIFDKIIQVLQAENLPNYFFKKSNMLVNPGHLCDDDYLHEANNIKIYVIRLFDEALMPTRGILEFERILQAQESETNLLQKWKELIDNLLPPLGTRGRRFCFAGSKNQREIASNEYTLRQMEYIGLLLENLLNVKQKILSGEAYEDPADEENVPENHLEDVIYLLVTIMDQARDKYLSAHSSTNSAILKNRAKIRSQFNSCTSKLVEIIRRDAETASLTFDDNLTLVKVILKWLYKAMDGNKRCLGPILRPYLTKLFTTSHSISWHLEFIKQRLNSDELEALGVFAELVNSAKITPAEGLIDAVGKNWTWAKSMMKMVEKNTLRVVFIEGRNKVYRHILSLPSYQREELERSGSKTIGNVVRRQSTLGGSRDYFRTILNKKLREEFSEIRPQHEILKNSSPLTLIINESNRRGDHRGYGDILKSLQSMQKLNMFQQVTSNLPQEDRIEIMELIQAMQAIKPKKSAKKWSSTLPQPRKTNATDKYTPKEESAGVRIAKTASADAKTGGSLIGSCRAARIREDSSVLLFQDSFKIKSLLNKSESFKF